MKKRSPSGPRIESFDFQQGRSIARKYEVVSLLGAGWEGEVYKIRERSSGIERAAKLFFPQRNANNKTARRYAKKLHKLRDCSFVIQYLAEEYLTVKGVQVTALVSEYVEGEMLSEFLRRQRGGRLYPFQAAHLLFALVVGLESIHRRREYHGDLHAENIIVRRHGLKFDLKVIDFIHHSAPKWENIQDDICDAIKIFYDALGGRRHYAKQPPEVKEICCGLKRYLILKKFPRVSLLRSHLETMEWS